METIVRQELNQGTIENHIVDCACLQEEMSMDIKYLIKKVEVVTNGYGYEEDGIEFEYGWFDDDYTYE